MHPARRDRARAAAAGSRSRSHRAADAYLVRRGDGKTIVAGYPWFTDWGRDTFIALRGLCLATGRLTDARAILLEWAGAVSEGMLPNRFPDAATRPSTTRSTPRSGTWSPCTTTCARSSRRARSRPRATVARLSEAVEAILDGLRPRHPLRHPRRRDDGLLAAGEPGVQLTWMDAKVGDWVVTPRDRQAGRDPGAVAQRAPDRRAEFTPASTRRDLRARRAAPSRTRFWNAAASCLYDVVDADHVAGRDDATFRPNQILAVGGLPFPLLDGRPRPRRWWTRSSGGCGRRSGLRTLPAGRAGLPPRGTRAA